MINRIFFISEKAILSGEQLPPEENVYYSILADPSPRRDALAKDSLPKGAPPKNSLQDAYTLIEHSDSLLALTLDIREPLTAENIRSITAFLFMPSYLTLESRPVINLMGDSPDLLRQEAASLSAYFSLQGIHEPLFHILSKEKTGAEEAGVNPSFHSAEALAAGYRRLLRNEHDGYATIFFFAATGETLRSAWSSLQTVEMEYRQEAPRLYALMQTNRRLGKELFSLTRKMASTNAELSHQQQYLEILRSGHATKELQDYYTHEYEILPLWYKRFGHILKVLTGKRTFQSLFRDGVKKYKN